MTADIEKLKDRASLCVNDPFNYLQIGTPGDVLRYAKIVTPAAVRQLLAALDQFERERDELAAEVERLKGDRLTFRTGYETASNRCVELETEVERLRVEKEKT